MIGGRILFGCGHVGLEVSQLQKQSRVVRLNMLKLSSSFFGDEALPLSSRLGTFAADRESAEGAPHPRRRGREAIFRRSLRGLQTTLLSASRSFRSSCPARPTPVAYSGRFSSGGARGGGGAHRISGRPRCLCLRERAFEVGGGRRSAKKKPKLMRGSNHLEFNSTVRYRIFKSRTLYRLS